MKRNIAGGILVAFVALVIVVFGCIYLFFVRQVPAGTVGIRVNLLGSSRGVDMQQLAPGRYFVSWNQQLFTFPTFTQNATYDNIQFQTKDGLVSSADIGLAYAVDKNKATLLFQKYRRGIDEITSLYLANMIRDAFIVEASRVDSNVLIDSRKDDLINAVENRVRAQVQANGIIIERIFWRGSIQLPPEIRARIIQTNETIQRTKQRDEEVKQVEAEARKKIAEAEGEAKALITKSEGQKRSAILEAEGQAQANLLLQKSLTPELMEYNIKTQALGRWSGTLPTYIGGDSLKVLPLTK